MDPYDLRRVAVWGAAAALVLAALAGWYVLGRSAGEAGGPGGEAVAIGTVGAAAGGGSSAGASSTPRLVVDVAGAVRQPGVYRFAAGARVEDALTRAGGATSRADLTQINRAAKLEDGRQVLVPLRPSTATGAGRAASAAAGAAAAGTGTAPAAPINLNSATLEQLDTLAGVGPATAQKILDYRTEHNGFGSVDELGEVPGIGDVRLAALRDKVRV